LKNLAEIEADVTSLGERIGATHLDLPSFGRTRDLADAYVEVSEDQYHFVVVERGQEITRQSTQSYDELLFWIFECATHNLAFNFELTHRIEDRDCRRMAFPKQVEPMGRISPAMATRLGRHTEAILEQAPSDDEPSRR
jgi:hypothetical protein